MDLVQLSQTSSHSSLNSRRLPLIATPFGSAEQSEMKYFVAIVLLTLCARTASSDLVVDLPKVPTLFHPAKRAEMQERAALDRGNSAAHLWLAKDLLLHPGKKPETEEAIRHHLDQAIHASPDLVEAQILLAQWYLRTSQPTSAIPHLESVATKQPALRFVLARIYRHTGDTSGSQQQLTLARNAYREQAEMQSGTIQDWLGWAQAELQLSDHDTAANVIRRAQRHHDDARLTRLLSTIFVAQSDHELHRAAPKPSRAFRHLRAALDLTPQSGLVLGRMSQLAHRETSLRHGVRDWIQTIVDAGHESAAAYLVLGNIAASQQEFELAVEHYLGGRKLDPRRPELIGNLAWCLFKVDTANLDECLLLAERAVQFGSRNPKIAAEFHITFGRLLVEAGRWHEAAHHLQQALEVYPERKDLLETLDRTQLEVAGRNLDT